MTRTPLSRSKGQGHQAALLSAALTRKVAAAVGMGTYLAWESTATLRLLGGAQGAVAPTGEEGRGHIVSTRAQLVVSVVIIPLQALPRVAYPVYCKAMAEVIVCCTTISSQQRVSYQLVWR